jgi:hypothetical protein
MRDHGGGCEVAAIPSGAQPATPAVKEQGAQAKEGSSDDPVGKGVEAAAAYEGNDEANGVGWDGCRAWDLGCACVEFVFSFHFFFFCMTLYAFPSFFQKYIYTHMLYTHVCISSPHSLVLLFQIYIHMRVCIYTYQYTYIQNKLDFYTNLIN